MEFGFCNDPFLSLFLLLYNSDAYFIEWVAKCSLLFWKDLRRILPIFLFIFVEFSSEDMRPWIFFLSVCNFLIIFGDSICLLFIGMLRFSVSFWPTFGILCVYMHFSIPEKLSDLLSYNFSCYFPVIHVYFHRVWNKYSIFISDLIYFPLLIFSFSILRIWGNLFKRNFDFIDLYCLAILNYFHSIFIIPFCLLAFGLANFSFSSLLGFKVKLLGIHFNLFLWTK